MTENPYVEALDALRDNLLKPMRDDIIEEGRKSVEASAGQNAKQIADLVAQVDEQNRGRLEAAEKRVADAIAAMETRLNEALRAEAESRESYRRSLVVSLKSLNWE